MKKILNVVCVYFSVPFFFGEQLTYFSKKGYHIHVSCSPSKKFVEYVRNHGCVPVEIEITRKFSIKSDVKALIKLIKYIKREKFDIVCGHTPKGGLLAMISAYLSGVRKRVFFRHGLVYETAHGLKRFILLNAERTASIFATNVVCVSPYLVERSIKDRLTRKSKLILLHKGSCNGVNAFGQFNPHNIDSEKLVSFIETYGISHKDFVIGYTGRLVIDKGIVELVDAFNELAADNNNIKLLLVGPLEERDSLPTSTINDIKSNPNIICTGLIEKNIEYYYAMMNIFVLCTHREGFGTSILEASSMELPVLTTSHSGSRDAIINDITGMYVETNKESLVNAISKYMDNPNLIAKQGIEGRRFVINNFEQSLIWKEIENRVYND